MAKLEGNNFAKLAALREQLVKNEPPELENTTPADEEVFPVLGGKFGIRKDSIDRVRSSPDQLFNQAKAKLIEEVSKFEKIFPEIDQVKFINKEWNKYNNLDSIIEVVYSYLDSSPKNTILLNSELEKALINKFESEKIRSNSPIYIKLFYIKFLFQLDKNTKSLDEDTVTKITKKLQYDFHQEDLSFFKTYGNTVGIIPKIECPPYNGKGKTWKLHQTAESLEKYLGWKGVVVPRDMSDQETADFLASGQGEKIKINHLDMALDVIWGINKADPSAQIKLDPSLATIIFEHFNFTNSEPINDKDTFGSVEGGIKYLRNAKAALAVLTI